MILMAVTMIFCITLRQKPEFTQSILGCVSQVSTLLGLKFKLNLLTYSETPVFAKQLQSTQF
jgi:hypothetical protein